MEGSRGVLARNVALGSITPIRVRNRVRVRVEV